MDLSYLNRGTPSSKPELAPVVSYIVAGDVFTTPKVLTITTNPQTLTPAQMVGGLTYSPVTVASVINTPAASDYKSFFQGTLSDGFAFQSNFYKDSTADTTINFGAGVTLVGPASSSSIVFGPGSTEYALNLIFVYNLSGNTWTVFATPRTS